MFLFFLVLAYLENLFVERFSVRTCVFFSAYLEKKEEETTMFWGFSVICECN